ncbi:ABC transporter ATP-binding protein [Bordetella avium]|uniref:Branched-chain amino acid ABC transporter, ATP-binding protein n=1 Tax=Bordetella avium (strain 197N) TaxID=360910 RepID=Q2KYN3_BORA1|nr:ABC transporter ATP-binding protein [Bordetella avium]AZY48055.1 ABC transporter ATP-binding protein [Bordetella avium]RIQ14706.1 ABC transporter ATP-binding protein [Bordetella avium]RIQ16819.1 ABC transporter ATP-binding protein [Bordetella avium]RIQ35154.1 ABC transporter ATP-binding protein [Bordetella avium]RIQ41053.1 ABC transporter ATP-binding protein [Bordetella avium]
MLKIRDLSAGYGKSEVLQGISLDVPEGKVVTLIGANGAGKTTTLKTLCGLIRPSAGTIEFEGRQIAGETPHQIVERGITMIPEGRQLFPFLTVRDNLLMGAYKRSARPVAQERLEEVLTLFPRVRERLDQFAGSLSGGEQQMVAIARGMMACPRLLIFDEPSLGLSPLLVEQMFAVIRDVVRQGITVLLVEQNVYHTLKLADMGYVLENGRIALSGSGEELLNSPHVRRAYLGH